VHVGQSLPLTGHGFGGGHLRSSGLGNLIAGQILTASFAHGLTSGHFGHGGIILSFGPHLMTLLHSS